MAPSLIVDSLPLRCASAGNDTKDWTLKPFMSGPFLDSCAFFPYRLTANL
jgi:hypothetical protein